MFAVAELRDGVAITDARYKGGKSVRNRSSRDCRLLARACRNGKLTVTAAGSLVDMLRASEMRLPVTGPEFESWARERNLL